MNIQPKKDDRVVMEHSCEPFYLEGQVATITGNKTCGMHWAKFDKPSTPSGNQTWCIGEYGFTILGNDHGSV